jgi:hypothetical protein
MSQLEVDKVIPQSGTTLTLGESGDTVSVPSGATVTKGFGTLLGGSSYIHAHATLQILDSPNTTSATTYQVYFSVGANTGLLNTDGGFSSITAFEIAG